MTAILSPFFLFLLLACVGILSILDFHANLKMYKVLVLIKINHLFFFYLLFVPSLYDFKGWVVKEYHGGSQNNWISSHGRAVHKLAKYWHFELNQIYFWSVQKLKMETQKKSKLQTNSLMGVIEEMKTINLFPSESWWLNEKKNTISEENMKQKASNYRFFLSMRKCVSKKCKNA